MRKRIMKLILSLTIVACFILTTAISTTAATKEDIENSIQKGITWLVSQQDPDGSWGLDELAKTSFAVLKLFDRAYETGKDPFETDTSAENYYIYHENVVKGLHYIFSKAYTYGEDKGINFQMGHHESYNTGIAMMAIVASRTPDRVVDNTPDAPVVEGLTYKQVVQGCVDFFTYSQNPDGAWRYFLANQPSDNSNTGMVTLGIRYAEEFGCTISPDVKSKLSVWLDAIQDDVDGDANDGGSWYMTSWDWVNLMKTGNLLFEFALVGDKVGVQRVNDAIDYIERHWNDMNSDPGWHDNYLSMYCLMKGLASQGIERIDPDGAQIDWDWFNEIADHIIARQNADGSWPGDSWGDSILTTEWALLTLEKITPPLIVTIDIKPGSYPNSINISNNGNIPVAVLGSSDFDVCNIDPATVLFADAPTLMWELEDVNADGYMDIVFHFDTQAVKLTIDDTEATLSGLTTGGFDFKGSDSVRIIYKKK